MSPAYHRFLSPPCHTLSPFVLAPLSPIVTTQIVTNFELMISRLLMQILDLIFAKICLFSTQTFLSTWKATLKSRPIIVITTLKVILMLLSKQYFFWRSDITLWLIPPLPYITLCHLFGWPPSPLGETYFLNGP